MNTTDRRSARRRGVERTRRNRLHGMLLRRRVARSQLLRKARAQRRIRASRRRIAEQVERSRSRGRAAQAKARRAATHARRRAAEARRRAPH